MNKDILVQILKEKRERLQPQPGDDGHFSQGADETIQAIDDMLNGLNDESLVLINGESTEFPDLELANEFSATLIVCAGEIDPINDELGRCPAQIVFHQHLVDYTINTTLKDRVGELNRDAIDHLLNKFGWFPGTYPSAIGDPYTYGLCPTHFKDKDGNTPNLQPGEKALSWFH